VTDPRTARFQRALSARFQQLWGHSTSEERILIWLMLITLAVSPPSAPTMSDPDSQQRASFIEAVKQGIKEADEGLDRPAEEVFAEMKEMYGLMDIK
jgi:hypothetical protein